MIEGLSASLAPGAADSFTLSMPADTGVGACAGTVSIASNDADENPFEFPVRGVVLPSPPQQQPGPDVTMLVNGTAVSSGATLNLGIRAPGGPEPALSLTLRNDGDFALTLGAFTTSAGFHLAGMPASGALAPGEAAALTLSLVATDPGTYAGALSMPTNDAEENPFTLNLTGEVSSPPAPPPPAPELPTSGLTVAAVAAKKISAAILGGGKASQGTLSVTVRSDSGSFSGPATVAVHASADGVLDAADTQLAALARTFKLGVGATAKPVNLKVPLGALPAGHQTLLVTVTATGVAATVAGPTVRVEPAHVNLVGLSATGGGPTPLALGKRATLAVPLQNTGNVATTKAPVAYTLLFTTDGTEAGTVFSTTAAGKVSLKPGAGTKPQKLTLTLPPAGTLAAGAYTVLVQLAAELNVTNGQTVALMSVNVV